jgi:dolichyl-phosphate beta-glucosyltransferase
MKVSFIVPAYQEERRVEKSLGTMIAFFGSIPYDCELILVIEKSYDRTCALTLGLLEKHPHLPTNLKIKVIENKIHEGKGFAVKTGMLRATGDIVFFMDLDLSTDLSEVVKFLQYFSSHPATQIVIGSRRGKAKILRRQNFLRQWLGRCFNVFVKAFSVKDIIDTQCGFKAFRKSTVKALFWPLFTRGFAFDVEILQRAQMMNLKIEQLPVVWKNDPHSKVKIIKDSFRMLIDLFKIRSRLLSAPSLPVENSADISDIRDFAA